MDHRTELEIDGSSVTTLADIVPPRGPLRVLFVGKTPSPASVEAGHYFMGRMGKGLWKRLDDVGVLRAANGEFADDLLLDNGFGMTDICKLPRPFGEEPTKAEYVEGWERVNGLVVAAAPAHPRLRLQGRARQGARVLVRLGAQERLRLQRRPHAHLRAPRVRLPPAGRGVHGARGAAPHDGPGRRAQRPRSAPRARRSTRR